MRALPKAWTQPSSPAAARAPTWSWRWVLAGLISHLAGPISHLAGLISRLSGLTCVIQLSLRHSRHSRRCHFPSMPHLCLVPAGRAPAGGQGQGGAPVHRHQQLHAQASLRLWTGQGCISSCASCTALCRRRCQPRPPAQWAPFPPQVWRVPDRAEGREGSCRACQGHRAHQLQRVLSFSQCKPLAEC